MPYKMGSCKSCQQRREWLAKQANNAKSYVRAAVTGAKNKGRK